MKTLNEFIARQEWQLEARRLKKEQQKKEIVLAALTEDPAKREARREALIAWHQAAVEWGDTLDRIIISLEKEAQ